ncbi:hypothetical protein Pcinc_034917 [Petrolisthes cinctipes]|uniref:Uncharacterized protein n=1 Tax=Petrolisthes cinctipes TaxID=88211 RepID=A0AAE1BZD2_PETCI|nr:hypothetical protein Pcinc_034917 [Petrolisthes cinctipes]
MSGKNRCGKNRCGYNRYGKNRCGKDKCEKDSSFIGSFATLTFSLLNHHVPPPHASPVSSHHQLPLTALFPVPIFCISPFQRLIPTALFCSFSGSPLLLLPIPETDPLPAHLCSFSSSPLLTFPPLPRLTPYRPFTCPCLPPPTAPCPPPISISPDSLLGWVLAPCPAPAPATPNPNLLLQSIFSPSSHTSCLASPISTSLEPLPHPSIYHFQNPTSFSNSSPVPHLAL